VTVVQQNVDADDAICWLNVKSDESSLWDFFRVPPAHGKSRNLGRPFSRPGKSWKIAKVMESHGK